MQTVSAMMLHESVGEVAENIPSEETSDADFLRPLERVTSSSDVIYASGDISWLKLVEAPIVDRPTPTTWRRRRLGQSPLPSDENAESRPARRSLFSPTSRPTPLRDVSNTAYRRCASDTVADSARLQPTRRLTKTQSMSTAVLSAVTDNDDDHRLVGDFTRPLCLPLVSDAKHCDLNTISHHTV